jgi:hypothetical protein
MPHRVNRTIRLRDWRVLGLAEYGDVDGVPLLFFHGVLGSRVQAAIFDRPGRRVGVRVIGGGIARIRCCRHDRRGASGRRTAAEELMHEV